jgi:hypothetical protein
VPIHLIPNGSNHPWGAAQKQRLIVGWLPLATGAFGATRLTDFPENMSVPRGGTGYSVFISSLSITSLLCDANGWPHLQGLSVSFITVTESIVTRPGLCNAAWHGRGSESSPLSLVDAQMVGSRSPTPCKLRTANKPTPGTGRDRALPVFPFSFLTRKKSPLHSSSANGKLSSIGL